MKLKRNTGWSLASTPSSGNTSASSVSLANTRTATAAPTVDPRRVKLVVRLVLLSVALRPVSSSGTMAKPVGAGKPVVLMMSERSNRSVLLLPARSCKRKVSEL